MSRRPRLVRPRGKRGGAKNRRRARAAAPHAEKIARYHTLEKQIARAADPGERAALVEEQERLGGLAVYQDQSTTGGDKLRGGESGKWCAKVLREVLPDGAHIRLLDVGAIAGTAYTKWRSWIDTTSIDLNPRAPHVAKCDFFDWPLPASDAERYDVVSLSLVVNFVGDLHRRGEMLMHAHHYLRPGGYVCLILPLACVTNSRYMTHEHLGALVRSAGFTVERNEDSRRLTRWLLRQAAPRNASPAPAHLTLAEAARFRFWDDTPFKKRELVPGATRNNFCILLP